MQILLYSHLITIVYTSLFSNFYKIWQNSGTGPVFLSNNFENNHTIKNSAQLKNRLIFYQFGLQGLNQERCNNKHELSAPGKWSWIILGKNLLKRNCQVPIPNPDDRIFAVNLMSTIVHVTIYYQCNIVYTIIQFSYCYQYFLNWIESILKVQIITR